MNTSIANSRYPLRSNRTYIPLEVAVGLFSTHLAVGANGTAFVAGDLVTIISGTVPSRIIFSTSVTPDSGWAYLGPINYSMYMPPHSRMDVMIPYIDGVDAGTVVYAHLVQQAEYAVPEYIYCNLIGTWRSLTDAAEIEGDAQ